MFTGLIEATGRVESVIATPGGRRVRVVTDLGPELRPGDSIALNGVCLTAVETGPDGFAADVSPETLRVTTFQTLDRGRRVNLERPLRADARLGGHFVLGHVDGVGTVTRLDTDGECHRLGVEIPASMRGWVVPKGSIAIDGVSLTINALGEDDTVQVALIPHTRDHTTLSTLEVGDGVNLEGDMIGRFVTHWLKRRAGAGV
jgi:riboflavin synthase